MSLKNYRHKEITLERLEEVIRKIEDPNDPDNVHKFINTAIHHSFKHNYNLRYNLREKQNR